MHYVNFTKYDFVIKINDNDTIEVKLTIDSTISMINKGKLNVIPLPNIIDIFLTRYTCIILSSLYQLTLTQTNDNNNNQLQSLSYEETLSASLCWRYCAGKYLP